MLTILGALLALWHHFWAQFRHLGVTFGAFGMHFLCQKSDWGSKGAQRGATPEIKSPIWTPFGGIFRICSYCLVQQSAYFKHILFSSILGRIEQSTGWAHMQSVHAGAVQTHFSIFTCFLKNSSQQTSFGVHFGDNFRQKIATLSENSVPKNCSKKGAPPHWQTSPYSNAGRLPEKQSRVRAF